MIRIRNPDGIRSALSSSDFDAVVAVSPENVAYSAGTIIETQKSIRDRLALVLWPKGGEPTFIMCAVEEPQAREESWITDIRSYVEFRTSPVILLAEVLREKGLDRGRVGMELGYLSARYFAELQREAPHVTFVEDERFFDEVKVVKTESEIAALQEGAVATEAALLTTYQAIRVGESEKSMRMRLIAQMLERGCSNLEFAYINAGSNTGFPHTLASDYQCKAGDLIKSDVGGIWNGYLSDIARTAVVGTPSPHQADIWARLREVHLASIEQLRPGRPASDAFLAMKTGMERVGLPFPLPHAGHSIGLTGHEFPMLTASNHMELKPNMTFMVETRARWIKQEGYHMEDLILVTEDGPKWLTDSVFNNEKLLAV